MDKYEEALKEIRLFIHNIEGHGYGGTSEYEGLRPLIDLLDKALEKARKFDQLVEAQKCSTCGNVETHACRTIGCPDYGIKAVNVEGLVSSTKEELSQEIHWECSPTGMIEAVIKYLAANGYLRTPANLTREGE